MSPAALTTLGACDLCPPPARVPDVGRANAAAIAWRIDRTEILPLRTERAEAGTIRPGAAS